MAYEEILKLADSISKLTRLEVEEFDDTFMQEFGQAIYNKAIEDAAKKAEITLGFDSTMRRNLLKEIRALEIK